MSIRYSNETAKSKVPAAFGGQIGSQSQSYELNAWQQTQSLELQEAQAAIHEMCHQMQMQRYTYFCNADRMV
jgi:competence protein ComGC